MSATVTYSLKGLMELQKQLIPFSNKLVDDIAEEIPNKIISNIKKGLAGINDKSGLPINENSTLEQKITRGQGTKSMIASKTLITRSNWFTRRVANGRIVSPKAIRKDIVGYLNNGVKSKRGIKYYKIMELGSKTPTWIQAMIRKRIKSFLKKYV